MGNFLWKYFLHKRYLTNMFLHIQVAPALCPLACPYEAFPKREEVGWLLLNWSQCSNQKYFLLKKYDLSSLN